MMKLAFHSNYDVDVQRKQAQAIASLPDSTTQQLCLLWWRFYCNFTSASGSV